MNGAFILLAFSATTFAQNPPVVTIDGCQIEGSMRNSYGGREFMSFQGIPYAKPPVGDLRFAQPEDLDDGLCENLDASGEHQQICPQLQELTFIPIGDEDCLYVNVYSPADLDDGALEDAQLPVMVYLHGGALYAGSGGYQVNGPELFMDKDVVLVTVSADADYVNY